MKMVPLQLKLRLDLLVTLLELAVSSFTAVAILIYYANLSLYYAVDGERCGVIFNLGCWTRDGREKTGLLFLVFIQMIFVLILVVISDIFVFHCRWASSGYLCCPLLYFKLLTTGVWGGLFSNHGSWSLMLSIRTSPIRMLVERLEQANNIFFLKILLLFYVLLWNGLFLGRSEQAIKFSSIWS